MTSIDSSTFATPTEIGDPINARILAISEDRIAGFLVDPFDEIARLTELPVDTVLDRLRAMLASGTIRRIRQTLMATNLAPGALVAWRVPNERLDDAFDFLWREDPFSGHIVIRSTDGNTPGSAYRLWTTLKVPQGFTIAAHCDLLAERIGADAYKAMPARKLFALGVGHVRRKGMEPGSKSDELGTVIHTNIVELTPKEWRVLEALKRELTVDEVRRDLWQLRAREAGESFDEFVRVARELSERKVIGRFSTFLEHVKPSASGTRVTRYNALFHWRVPEGREIEAGREIGRFHILTHCYWREGGPEFANVNIMAVAHGTDKATVLAHKDAIDAHLQSIGMPVSYTNVFWGGRSEIKPSEISPRAYERWYAGMAQS
ncbi:MAG TPA: Lrp/AsnC family transcriptional regulator [Casimicrobiaceae bacterium]|jgi:DNA-binding Lrp family transcriptional regulator|nr:Lrp/AsnC family transcriptional regulator [Casimicrobiaceae bacterium]